VSPPRAAVLEKDAAPAIAAMEQRPVEKAVQRKVAETA